MVLRAWPPDGPGREHLERVHRLALSDWPSWDSSRFPSAIEPVDRSRITRVVSGKSRLGWRARPTSAQPARACRLRASFAGLAAFHQRLAGEQVEAVSPGLRKRYETVAQLIAGWVRHARGGGRSGTAASAPSMPPPRAGGWRWLGPSPRCCSTRLTRRPRWSLRLQPCLRDARPEHFLFEGDRLSGLVDFGAMGVDCVAGDLARLIGEWLDGDPAARGEALAAYERIRPLEPAETISDRRLRVVGGPS